MPHWVKILLSGLLLSEVTAAPSDCGCGDYIGSSSSPCGGGSSAGPFIPGVPSPNSLPAALPGIVQGSCGDDLGSGPSSNNPPEIIIRNDGSPCSTGSFSISIQEPVLPVHYTQPQKSDPFTGRQYGLSMVAPPPAPRILSSIGTFDTAIQDVISVPFHENIGTQRPTGPSMNIEIRPAGGPGPFGSSGPDSRSGDAFGPSISLGEFPVQIQDPVIPHSGRYQTPKPVKLLTGLNARLDRIVLPASILKNVPSENGAGFTSSTCWHESVSRNPCSCE